MFFFGFFGFVGQGQWTTKSVNHMIPKYGKGLGGAVDHFRTRRQIMFMWKLVGSLAAAAARALQNFSYSLHIDCECTTLGLPLQNGIYALRRFVKTTMSYPRQTNPISIVLGFETEPLPTQAPVYLGHLGRRQSNNQVCGFVDGISSMLNLTVTNTQLTRLVLISNSQ
jgi:hypothetical protein